MIKIMSVFHKAPRVFANKRYKTAQVKIIPSKMKEDIFATSRNGHLLKDTFDKSTNTLDIRSNGLYPANVLSNLAHNEFVFEGVKCGSVEGLLQSLKTSDPVEQTKICSLYGGSAKKMSAKYKKWLETQKLYWQGRQFDRVSEEYQKFLSKIYDECYSQNNTFKTALDSTKGTKLIHSDGKNNVKTTVITAEEFVNILTKLRDKN